METATLPAPVPANLNGSQAPALMPANPLAMPVSPRFVVDRYNAIQEIVSLVFKDGIHYGLIPGTGTKKTLLKPGFDALCTAFQFSPDFIKQPESIESAEFINLVYKCVLTSASGRVVATGIGSCNSKEEKYRWINSARKCPACGKEAIGKSKEEWGGGWYCNAKKDGCGAKFKKGDRAIEDQEAGRKENDNAWNHHNTLTKMGQKRAGMAAIITACGLSGDFTQDVEDFDINDKSRRNEPDMPPIDVQANARQWEDDARQDSRDDANVRDWRQEAEGAMDAVEGQFTEAPAAARAEADAPTLFDAPPAAPNVTQEVAKAYADTVKELGYCKTKEDFQKLKAFLVASGPNYTHPQVTNLVNNRYRQLFPATTKPAPGASAPAAR